MLAKLFASKGSRRALLLCTFLAALVCIFSLITPVLRKKSAMEETGSQLALRFSSLALAISSLEGESLSYGLSEEAASPRLEQLLDTLSSQHQLYRSYILGKSVDGKLFYLADSGAPSQDAQAASPGSPYEGEPYPQKCLAFAKETLEQAPWQGHWYPQPIGEGLVVCYFPLTGQEDTPAALLGVEVSLDNPNFAQFQFINFHRTALWSGIVLVILGLFCLLVRSSRKNLLLKEQLAGQQEPSPQPSSLPIPEEED